MPRGRYSNLSVRREVREELDRLREELKINDLNDLLILLVKKRLTGSILTLLVSSRDSSLTLLMSYVSFVGSLASHASVWLTDSESMWVAPGPPGLNTRP